MLTTFPKIEDLTSTVTLNNGVEMPVLGLGTWQLEDGPDAVSTLRDGLAIGYRHIDTAAVYGNEASVGRAVADSGLARDQLFITTKLWNDRHGTDRAPAALDESLKRLGTDYIDLFLIHWPCGTDFLDTWLAMEQLVEQGKARAIGVSNFLKPHLQTLLADCTIKPAVDQIETHPWLVQSELHGYLRDQQIVAEGWSPLMQGRFGEVSQLAEIGQAHGKSAPQVLIRWALQHGVVTIPKASSRKHLEANAAVFDFALSGDEMARLDALDRHQRLGPDPFEFQVR